MALPPRGVVEIRSADAEHVIALYRPLALTYFSRPPKDSELAILRALVQEGRAEGLAGGMLFVVARKNAAGGIDPRVRKFFEQMVRENSGRFGASAVVVLMQGFGASLMRSFLTGLLLLTGKGKTFHIFDSIEAACRWLAPLHQIDEAELRKVVAEVTAKISR